MNMSASKSLVAPAIGIVVSTLAVLASLYGIGLALEAGADHRFLVIAWGVAFASVVYFGLRLTQGHRTTAKG
jgi:hypothetical protein